MARFLWAAEDIVLNLDKSDCDGQRAWTTAIAVSVREHADFFSSPDGEIEKTCYYEPLVRIIDEALGVGPHIGERRAENERRLALGRLAPVARNPP